jgi:beta-lactamase regulating signal transducer with metallopeptidase domain
MEVFLIAVTVRPVVLAAIAGVVRVRSAAVRHAVWTIVMAGMLAIAIGAAVLPRIPVRVFASAQRAHATAVSEIAVYRSVAAPPREVPWGSMVYGAGLFVMAVRMGYGYWVARSLVRSAIWVRDEIYESARVAVPVTLGWQRPAILLPAGWDAWAPEKLDAVLVHERNHIRRGDWAIAVLAGINRCVFWFHPLAWWLAARLTVLAEEACDDASLPLVMSREYYAQVLVEMAAAVRGGWDAVAMAKGGDVTMRVERILDEGRAIGAAMTGRRWAAMAMCAVPVMWVAAVVRPARVIAQDGPAAVVVQAQVDDSRGAAARDELARVEAAIAKLRRENQGRLPEQFQANVAQLNSIQMMLAETNEAMSRLQQQRYLLETRLQNLNAEMRYRPAPNPAAAAAAEERIRAVRAQIAGVRDTLTANHPSVKRAEQELASAEKVREAIGSYEESQNQKRALDLEGSINMLKTEMQNLNLHMDAKVQQASELQRQIAAYQLRIESGPEVEARYGALLRERDRARQQIAESQQRPAGRSVKIAVTFGADGKPQRMRVTGGVGPKEDEQALEWAKSLRFAPRKNGPTATGEVTIEVPLPGK